MLQDIHFNKSKDLLTSHLCHLNPKEQTAIQSSSDLPKSDLPNSEPPESDHAKSELPKSMLPNSEPPKSDHSTCLGRCWHDDQQRSQGDRCLIGCWSCPS
jgi:hypothetical protein